MPDVRVFFLHLKSALASPRRYLASWRQLKSMGTQIERWSDLTNFDAAWDDRTQMMAAMIQPGSAVLEFGSGREQLERFLPAECTYQPCDMVPRSPRTLVCDLNQGFPVLGRRYDVVVCSGVLEYIRDLPKLLQCLRACADRCVLSYMSTDGLECVATRMQNGWVHHYSNADLIALCSRAGFHVEQQVGWHGHTILKLV